MLARPSRNAVSNISRTVAASCSRLNHSLSPVSSLEGQDLGAILAQPEFASKVVHGRSFVPAYYHPRTHNIPVALIHFRSHHVSLLNLFTHFCAHTASALAIPISKTIPLPTQRSLWTVPKSPFVHKSAQENFERKVHKRAIKAWDADDEVVDRWIKYLEAHALAGVGIRVVRWQRAPVGVRSLTMEAIKKQMALDASTTSSEKVKALGEKIVQQELAANAGEKVIEQPATSS
ncbi:ribosomal protein S10 [Panus rudis PR-1116 ss-1]|nr:ribosomal protein S10 [Panus rudis PR-1116 ss-1]